MDPETAMRAALVQARRARGRTFPNPPVGAVVFRGDRILGRGYSRPAGGPHAEVVALERAERRHGRRAVRGASMAVTLEPCSHHGRTGPCADLIVEHGIARVWVGHRDPNPEVSGRGLRRLRRAGVEARIGVLEAACREQHRGFLSVLERGRPFVTLKLAATLDGRIATASGESRWITGSAARAHVHALRAQSDAILIGSGTARADDPDLTARRAGRVVHRPVRVLVDSKLAVATGARIFRTEDPERTWVLCGRSAPERRRRALVARGVRLLPVAAHEGHLRLDRALRRLGSEGLGTVLVEGGGRLAAGLLGAGLVDELLWFAAPRLIGGDGRAAVAPLGTLRLRDAIELEEPTVRRLGDDWLIRARPRPRGGRR